MSILDYIAIYQYKNIDFESSFILTGYWLLVTRYWLLVSG